MAPSIKMSLNNFSTRSCQEIKNLEQITSNSQWNFQSVISKTSFNSDSPCINRHCLNRLSMRENLLVCMKRFWRKNLCIWTRQNPTCSLWRKCLYLWECLTSSSVTCVTVLVVFQLSYDKNTKQGLIYGLSGPAVLVLGTPSWDLGKARNVCVFFQTYHLAFCDKKIPQTFVLLCHWCCEPFVCLIVSNMVLC